MGKGKKDLLATILCRSGAVDILRLHRRSALMVFAYHRVYQGRLSSRFDSGVFGPHVDLFERQMRWLRRSADVLSEADVLYLIRAERPIPGRCVMVTFDDGYIDNHRLAFPVLRALNMPAVFFIPTNSIEQRSLGPWDIISYLVKRCTKGQVRFQSRTLPTRTAGEKAETIEYLLSFIKRARDTATADVLNTLSQACEVELPPRDVQSEQLMTWEQIGEMDEKNMAIGSHTQSHSVLSAMSQDAQRGELERSKQILEARLKHKISSLSYPVGGESHYSNATKAAARAAGYTMAFSFTKHVNRDRIGDPFDISRIPPPETLSGFRAITVAPFLFL